MTLRTSEPGNLTPGYIFHVLKIDLECDLEPPPSCWAVGYQETAAYCSDLDDAVAWLEVLARVL